MHLPGLDPRRADLMVAGAVLLDTLLKKLDAEEITLCDLALREGVLLDYIHRASQGHRARRRYPDVRRRSVIELAERCAWEAEHSRQVAALALTLFDYTKRIHEPRRSRARVARVRGLPARHRQPHQLREAPSPFVLPDQERRPARLRAGRDRRDRAGHPLSPPRDAEARAHRASTDLDKEHRRTVTVLVGVPAPGRDARSQPARRGARRRGARAARRDPHQRPGGRRRRAGSLGGAQAGRARSRRRSTARSSRSYEGAPDRDERRRAAPVKSRACVATTRAASAR